MKAVANPPPFSLNADCPKAWPEFVARPTPRSTFGTPGTEVCPSADIAADGAACFPLGLLRAFSSLPQLWQTLCLTVKCLNEMPGKYQN
jgi:hypothetical protein